MATYYDMHEESGPSLLNVLPVVLWQRRWLIILPTILATLVGVAAAYLIPPMYESTATVLIESQQLTSEGGTNMDTLADLIDQRISRARERVTSRQALIQLIRSNGLYPKEQAAGQPFSSIVDKMRDAVMITGVAGEGGARGMFGGRQTIALKIAFDYPDPEKTQAVAQLLVNKFLEVDATTQTDKAVGNKTFLDAQVSGLRDEVNAVEDKINKIRAENGGVLAFQSMSTGNPAADAARIDSDIARLQNENAQLAAQSATDGTSPAVTEAQRRLAELQSRLSDSHPDVIAAKQALAAVRASVGGPVASNGVAIAQISSNRSQIASMQSAKAMMLSSAANAQNAQSRAPGILAQIDQLEKQAEVKRDQLRMIGMRAQNADLNAKMEVEQKGERLTLADPPVVPDSPFKPNRQIIIAGAFSGGVGLGLALVLALELVLRPIRGVDAVRAATGMPPLSIIPDYERKVNWIIRFMEKRSRRKADAKASKAFRT